MTVASCLGISLDLYFLPWTQSRVGRQVINACLNQSSSYCSLGVYLETTTVYTKKMDLKIRT